MGHIFNNLKTLVLTAGSSVLPAAFASVGEDCISAEDSVSPVGPKAN